MISMDKEYMIVDQPVRILCIDAPGRFPVVCVTQDGSVLKRDSEGKKAGSSPIEEVKKSIRRKMWYNVYEDDVNTTLFTSRKECARVARETKPFARCLSLRIHCSEDDGEIVEEEE